MQSDDPDERLQRREPVFNNFPSIVIALSAAIIGVSVLELSSGEGVRDFLWNLCAVVYSPNVQYVGRPLGDVGPLFLHVFLHANFLHLIMNMAMMVAFGPAIAKAFGTNARGTFAFLVFFFACAACGALAQTAWSMFAREEIAAIGASTALSGFFAAAGWIMGGLRGALRLSVPWLIINIVIALIGSSVMADVIGMRIAWAAHIGGLAGGFVLFPLMIKLVRPEIRVLD